MSKSSLMSSWMSEFCAPVVMVVPTAEVEAISLKNGLLFHDLLRAFSTLDVNETIRSNGNLIHVKEAHIRFERSTEFVAKPSGTIEQLLRSIFQEFDIARLPANIAELKNQSPTAWTPQIEQVICRSMSFSEYEMLSHPIAIITAVSTTDFDVVACMQEMVSYHHVPSIMTAGQYETDVHRIFLIVHDPQAAPDVDAPSLLRKLQSHFPSSQTKLMVINSNPLNNLNLRQPDLWSRVIHPLYFPQHAPLVGESNTAVDPQSGSKIYGACLSMEDFITIRDFCLSLYHLEIVPLLERRINNLSKIVADARRGVKNVIKSLWGGGKKKEDAPMSMSGVRYRVDRIEAQILLLADTCFVARDYETALTMYKMVREDFRSDKSMIHLAHTCLMGIACNIATDTNRRELGLQLDSLSQILATFSEPSHAHAFFALLASDVYIHHIPQRAPVEAATFLLTAAASCSKLDLTSGLLIERAAQLFLQAGMYRRFVFHEVLSGLKIRSCGPRPALHAIFCASCALLMQDEAKWGGLKAKLALLIAGDMKTNIPDSTSQYILLALKAVISAVNDAGYVTGRSTNIESVAMAALTELANESVAFAPLAVSDDWEKASTFETIQNPYYVFNKDDTSSKGNDKYVPAPLLEISNLPLPEVDHTTVSLMLNSNGYFSKEIVGCNSKDSSLASRLSRMLSLEQSWIDACESNLLSHATTQNFEDFWLKLAEIEYEDQLKYAPEGALILNRSTQEMGEVQIPLGETFSVQLTFKNPLSMPMNLSDVSLDLSPADAFEVKLQSLTVPPKSSIVVTLQASPLRAGHFSIDRVRWTLREAGLSVRQAIHKPGPLLHKTLHQRTKHERAEDKSLRFEVIAPYPLLALSIDGLSDEILQGQLVLVSLTVKNEGTLSATNIMIKSNRPHFMFFTKSNQNANPTYLPVLGPTCTVTRLSPSTVIPPGESMVIHAWMRPRNIGKQQIAFVVSYLGRSASNTILGFGNTTNLQPRTSFLNAETTVMQSVNMQARVLQKQASPTEQILIIDLLNRLEPKKDRRRNSSKGIVDFNLITDENAVIVTEGRCKMEGVSVLGFSQPRVDTHKNDSFRSVVASLTENITLNFALETNFANYSSTLGSDTDASPNTYFSMPCSWAMPLQLSPPSSDSNTISSSAKSLQNDVTVLMVMERFLIYDVALQQSRLHLQEAFKFLMLGDEEQSKGPKSIAQVRKERESNLSPRVGDSTSNSVNHESTYSPKFIHNIDSVDQILGSVQDRARQLISLGVSASCYNIPVSLSDLTRLLNMDRKVAVIAVWTCRWHGKIRTGINFVRNVSPIPTHKEPVSLVSPRSSSSIPHPLRYAEDLLISLNHPGTLTLPSGHRAATTQVQVQLWNTGSLPLYITLSPDGIEPLSTISPSRSQDSDITSSLAALTVKVNDSADNITPDYSRRQQGMTWQGKTKYVGLELLPYAKMQVLFFVKFTSVGIYDLQRFSVKVGLSRNSDDHELVVKKMTRQSLISID